MFDKDFFPTPRITFQDMVRGYDLRGVVILEPEGGKGYPLYEGVKRKKQYNDVA